MRILLLGSSGRIGKEIVLANSLFGFNLIYPNSRQLNIIDSLLHPELLNINPDLIINAAAFTDVDNAETNTEQAYNINKLGPQRIAKTCQELNIPIIHISTDYVFSGDKNSPYVEEDIAYPINVYGKSKFEGEKAVSTCCEKHIILRTSWIFGEDGGSFVKTILKLAAEKSLVNVVENEMSCPTTSLSTAYAVLEIAKQIKHGNKEWGVYHFCGSPGISRYAYALEMMEIAKLYTSAKLGEIQAITSDLFPAKALRPHYSVMNTDKILGAFNILSNNWRSDLAKIIPFLMRNLDRNVALRDPTNVGT